MLTRTRSEKATLDGDQEEGREEERYRGMERRNEMDRRRFQARIRG